MYILLLFVDDKKSCIECRPERRVSTRASPTSAMHTLHDRLSLFEFFSWHAADAVCAKVCVTNLNASQTTQILVSWKVKNYLIRVDLSINLRNGKMHQHVMRGRCIWNHFNDMHLKTSSSIGWNAFDDIMI